MEDIARNPDNPDRPDAWMWLFDDEDASRDATKKIRQMFFFPSYLNTQFFSNNTQGTTQALLTNSPAPLPHFASTSSSPSPTPFAMPSRASTSKFSEKTAHIATISAADKGDHAPSSCKDESQANSGDAVPRRRTRAAISRCVLLVPIVIDVRVCTNATFSFWACIHTPRNRVRLLLRSPPRHRVLADDPHHEDPIQALCPFCAYAIPYDRTSLHAYSRRSSAPSTSPVKNTPLPPLPLRVLSSLTALWKLGTIPALRHFRHIISCFPTFAPSAQCAQEQDTDNTFHGARRCTVPPAHRAQVRLSPS